MKIKVCDYCGEYKNKNIQTYTMPVLIQHYITAYGHHGEKLIEWNTGKDEIHPDNVDLCDDCAKEAFAVLSTLVNKKG